MWRLIVSKNSKINKSQRRWPMMGVVFVLLSIACLIFGDVAFAKNISIGSLAYHITESLGNLARLITAGSYIAGFGFAVGAILKFKAHKDNPTQIPVGTPIALLFIAAALIFLPAIFGVTEKTMFGGSAATGTIKGVVTFG